MAGIIDEQDPNVAVYTTKRSEKKQIWAGQVKKSKIVGVHTARKWEKIFRVKQKISYLARIISTSRRLFFANLTTFERRSGLKIFSLL